MDEDPIFQRERYLMEQIRELDEEELQIEEVETLSDDSSADDAAAKYVVSFAFVLSAVCFLAIVEYSSCDWVRC